jgi:hypothetical protein
MVPESEELRCDKNEEALAALDALTEGIAAGWMAEKSGTEILEEMREERYQLLLPPPPSQR